MAFLYLFKLGNYAKITLILIFFQFLSAIPFLGYTFIMNNSKDDTHGR